MKASFRGMSQQSFFSGLHDAHRTLEDLLMVTKVELDPEKVAELMSRLDVTLRRHFEIEDEYLYPPLLEKVDDWEDRTVLLGAHEDHQVIMRLLVDLEQTPPTDERFRGKVHALDRLWEHHMNEEEGVLYEMARRYLGTEGFYDLWKTIRAEEKAQKEEIEGTEERERAAGEETRTERRLGRQRKD